MAPKPRMFSALALCTGLAECPLHGAPPGRPACDRHATQCHLDQAGQSSFTDPATQQHDTAHD